MNKSLDKGSTSEKSKGKTSGEKLSRTEGSNT